MVPCAMGLWRLSVYLFSYCTVLVYVQWRSVEQIVGFTHGGGTKRTTKNTYILWCVCRVVILISENSALRRKEPGDTPVSDTSPSLASVSTSKTVPPHKAGIFRFCWSTFVQWYLGHSPDRTR